MSVDPNQLPKPAHYNATLATVTGFTEDEATAVARFFSAYEQFAQSLVSLTSGPADFLVAFTMATDRAREATVRGHAALCALGLTPPALFPHAAFAELMPPNCLPGPFQEH